MSSKIQQTAYYKALPEDKKFATPKEFTQYVQKNQQYCYADISYADFSKKYSSEGWGGRKVTAIPQALWSGIIKTIYHLCTLMLTACFASTSYRKATAFYAARDLQKGCGHLITFFHDKYGSYLVQESLFHMKCYDQFTKQSTKPSPASLPKIEISADKSQNNHAPKAETNTISEKPSAPVDYPIPTKPFIRQSANIEMFDNASSVSLKKFQESSSEQKKKLLDQYSFFTSYCYSQLSNPNTAISSSQEPKSALEISLNTLANLTSVTYTISDQRTAILNYITDISKDLDPNLLDQLSLIDIIPDPTLSCLVLAQMSDEEINGLTLKKVKDFSNNQLSFILKRMSNSSSYKKTR